MLTSIVHGVACQLRLQQERQGDDSEAVLTGMLCPGVEDAASRDTASAAAAALCAMSGAHMLRMHNAAAGVQAAQVADAVRRHSAPPWA